MEQLSAVYERTPVLTLHGSKELRNIRAGDMIWNGLEYVEVVSFSQARNYGVSINTGKGNIIRCSTSQVLFVDGLPTEAGSIKRGDVVDNIELVNFSDQIKYIPFDQRELVSTDKNLAWIYGLWCGCGYGEDQIRFYKATKTTIDTLIQCCRNFGDEIHQVETDSFLLTKDGPIVCAIDMLQGNKRKCGINYYHLVNNDVFKIFFLGFLSGRGYIKINDDKTFNLHFSTNNERIVYGAQFELYKRFGIRMSARIAENSSAQKVFKCTVIGGDKLMESFSEIGDLYEITNMAELAKQNEFSVSKVSDVRDKDLFNMVSIKLKDETPYPIFGYIKVK